MDRMQTIQFGTPKLKMTKLMGRGNHLSTEPFLLTPWTDLRREQQAHWITPLLLKKLSYLPLSLK